MRVIRRHLPRRLEILALVAMMGGGVLLLLLAGGRSEPVAQAASGGSEKAKVVGTVVAVSGTAGGLTVKPDGERERPLREGDQLHLGDVIDPAGGVGATLELTLPSGVSSDRELVFVDPSAAAETHSVSLVRTGKRETRVTIGD